MPDAVTKVEFLVIGLLGLAVGSFTNTLIHRVPRLTSVVSPGSTCPQCQTPIRYSDNLPILSFILLRGRCRNCHWRIPIQYPLVEAAVCGLYLLAFATLGWNWSLIPVFGYICSVTALSVIDLKHRLLPDAITYPSFVLALPVAALGMGLPGEITVELEVRYPALWTAGLVGAGGLVLWLVEVTDFHLIGKKLDEEEAEPGDEEPQSWLSPAIVGLSIICAGIYGVAVLSFPGRDEIAARNADLSRVVDAYLGAAIAAGMLWIMRLGYFLVRRGEGTGFGDIKMMLFVGAFLGWRLGFLTLLLGSLLGSLIGVAAAIRTRDRRVKIPFGLFLGAAAIISLFLGTQVLGWYLKALMG
ncbi:MAG: prepilin peptidase [Acidobacteria bacterium]|nr:prepilin peptidase [Acidobacteriota bacterium]